jgi:hypothetical protein
MFVYFGINCADRSSQYIFADGTIMKIADRISNLNAKPTKLIAVLNSAGNYITLAEAPVFIDGSFEINLPDIIIGYSYLSSPANICGDLNINPESLKIAVVDGFWLFDSNQNTIGYIFQGSTQDSINGRLGQKMVSRWYANQRSQIIGRANCCSNVMAVDFQLNLKKGWNEVVRYFHSGVQEKIHTCNHTESMPWFMFERKNTTKFKCSKSFTK